MASTAGIGLALDLGSKALGKVGDLTKLLQGNRNNVVDPIQKRREEELMRLAALIKGQQYQAGQADIRFNRDFRNAMIGLGGS